MNKSKQFSGIGDIIENQLTQNTNNKTVKFRENNLTYLKIYKKNMN